VLSVRNVKLQALPGFTFAVDIPLTKTMVPAFAAPPADGFSSSLGEKPSWNSQDLQNTPYSGNFHGRWPLYPDYAGDTGARPVSIPNQTAFAATITVTEVHSSGFTLAFSEPLDPGPVRPRPDHVRRCCAARRHDHRVPRRGHGRQHDRRSGVVEGISRL